MFDRVYFLHLQFLVVWILKVFQYFFRYIVCFLLHLNFLSIYLTPNFPLTLQQTVNR
jgi:hypothetical protein